MGRKAQWDRLIDVAAHIDDGRASGRLGPAPAGLAEELALIQGCVAQHGDVPDLPERLVRQAIAFYPAGEDVVDIVLSYVRGVLDLVRASAGVTVAGPAGAAAIRNESRRELPYVSLSKTFNRAVIDVIVEGSGAAGCTFTVQATDVRTMAPLGQSRVELVSGSRELASASLVEGRAQFEEVRTGKYELVVRKNDAVLGIMTITIRP